MKGERSFTNNQQLINNTLLAFDKLNLYFSLKYKVVAVCSIK